VATRIVVLGGGFAGVHAAKYLTEAARGREDVEVELLSEENYFVFQPLLPEVAAGGIAATHVVNPIREMVPGARFRCCKIIGVDLQRKKVQVVQGEGLEVTEVSYHHLVFCLGKVSSFATMPGAAEHAFAMKDLGDAFRLRNHVIRCLEHADIEHDAKRKKRLLTFVVAGGGFSGVETMGELQELVDRSLPYFPHVKKEEVRYLLVHSGKAILPEMPASLGAAAQRILEKRRVEVKLSARVRAASATMVYLADGQVIPATTFVCTVGNAPNPIVKDTIAAGGFTEARMNGRGIGVFEVDRELRCVGQSGYWAVGDCAGVPSPDGKGLCPPTAQFAIREAKTCARNVLATIDGGELSPFEFEALGMLASLGQRSAVAKVFGIELTGFIAWFLWRTVYLMKLPGVVRRLRVMIDWTLDLFFPRDITQLQVFKLDRLHVSHYEPGEEIIRRGDIGRELYMIVRGEVEVIESRGEGKTEALKARLGPKEVFGEKALLENVARTATVRAVGAVDVVVLSRGDFVRLVDQLPALSDYFTALLEKRHPQALAGNSIATTGLAEWIRQREGMAHTELAPPRLDSPRAAPPS
jgi:NADH dehydrogenase